jgi:hypothetical protein
MLTAGAFRFCYQSGKSSSASVWLRDNTLQPYLHARGASASLSCAKCSPARGPSGAALWVQTVFFESIVRPARGETPLSRGLLANVSAELLPAVELVYPLRQPWPRPTIQEALPCPRSILSRFPHFFFGDEAAMESFTKAWQGA